MEDCGIVSEELSSMEIEPHPAQFRLSKAGAWFQKNLVVWK